MDGGGSGGGLKRGISCVWFLKLVMILAGGSHASGVSKSNSVVPSPAAGGGSGGGLVKGISWYASGSSVVILGVGAVGVGISRKFKVGEPGCGRKTTPPRLWARVRSGGVSRK